MSLPVPPRIAAVRREICARQCEAPCAGFTAGTLNQDDPASACPRAGWLHAWGTYSGSAKPSPFGVGDAVAYVAQPIANAIDAVAGTNVANCGGCTARKAALNAAVPNVRHPFKRE